MAWRNPRAFALLLVLLVPSAGAASSGHEFEILYSERTSEFTAEATLGEGESKTFRFVVSEPNVTRIDFLLRWQETGDAARISGPDRFALSVDRPDGTHLPTERANDGDVHVVAAPINRMPSGESVRGDDMARILERNTGMEGMGEWRAIVRLEDVGNPEGARFDEGNDFSLTVVLTFYEGTPMRVVTLSNPSGLVARGEERSWGLAAGGLAAVAVALGLVITLQARRRRLSHHRVTNATSVSPDGDTSTPSKR